MAIAADAALTTPTISWANPASIVYGTALSSRSSTRRPASPGRSPTPRPPAPSSGGQRPGALGQLRAHRYRRLHGATATATISVAQATPTISWANPASIVYGTALSATQLDATASVPGTFTYTPAVGTVLEAGNGQTLSVSFVPTDTDRLHDGHGHGDDQRGAGHADDHLGQPGQHRLRHGAEHARSSTRRPACPGPSPTPRPSAPSSRRATARRSRSASCPPIPTDYTDATATATINVAQATPTISWANPASIVYGTALSSAQLDATASVPGTFTYTPAAAPSSRRATARRSRSASCPPTPPITRTPRPRRRSTWRRPRPRSAGPTRPASSTAPR